MQRIHITQFARDKGQAKAACALRVTQGALSKAIRLGREIYVICHEDGTFTAEELRQFPSQQKSATQPIPSKSSMGA